MTDHVPGCYYSKETGQRCVYWCPTGGILHHLRAMIDMANQYTMTKEQLKIRAAARKALMHWSR